ncbi:DNA polymerase III subunit beta, partial [Thermodesulfobacteriota bacterium]
IRKKMKFIIKKDDIIDVLSNVQGLTGRKSNLAITANILIKTSDSGITLIATDLETGFEGSYPATIESEGSVAINARKFYEIVRDFPTDEILVTEIENRWIEIGNKNIEYHLVGMNSEDFPEIPKIEECVFFDIDSEAFKKMIEKTLVIGVSEDKRSHILGVYFERINTETEKIVRMVSTDGSRLSKVDYVYDKDFYLPAGPGIIIPKKGLNEVGKFLDVAGTVQIGLKDNNFITKKDTETIIIRLLEGDFPQYKDIINKGDANIIKFDRQLFLKMIKRMSILFSENYKGAIFNFLKDKLIITSTNPDFGESKEDIKINYTGEPIEVAFNSRFFIDALNVIEDNTVVVNIFNEEKPCLLEGEEDKNFLSVIMPMRI